MKMLNLYIMLVFSACSAISKPINKASYYIDPEFKDDFESFVVDADKYDVKINVKGLNMVMVELSEMNLPLAGYCDITTKTVLIWITSWKHLSVSQRKQLIYHELGHCLLLRKHTTDMLSSFGTCYRSIMFPNITDNYCFDIIEQDYIKELFTNPYNDKLSNGVDFK